MKKSILFNRTLHLVSYVLLSLTSCLFVSCDKDDDWDKNLGNTCWRESGHAKAHHRSL